MFNQRTRNHRPYVVSDNGMGERTANYGPGGEEKNKTKLNHTTRHFMRRGVLGGGGSESERSILNKVGGGCGNHKGNRGMLGGDSKEYGML